MKKYTFSAFVLVLCTVFTLILGGCRQGLPPSSTTPTTATTAPTDSIEAAPPATTEYVDTHVLLDAELIIAMLDEAGALLDNNETITLMSHEYELAFIKYQKLIDADIVSVEGETITILNCRNKEYREELRFLIFLNFMLERFSDCYMWRESPEILSSEQYRLLFFYSEFSNAGYDTAEDYITSSLPNDGTYIFRIYYYDGDVLGQSRSKHLDIYNIKLDEYDYYIYTKHLETKNEG